MFWLRLILQLHHPQPSFGVQKFSIIIEIFCLQRSYKLIHPEFQVGKLKNLFRIPAWGDEKRAETEDWNDTNTTNGVECNYKIRYYYSNIVNNWKSKIKNAL